MIGHGLEQAARIIAENIASAFESPPNRRSFQVGEREIVVAGLIRELLPVLQLAESDTLAQACNRYLAVMAEVGIFGPRVEAIDPGDESVTMRRA